DGSKDRRAAAIVFEAERSRRFGPEDELRAVRDRLPRQRDIVVEDRRGAGDIPLLTLIDVALYEPDLDRIADARPFGGGGAGGTPNPATDDEHRGGQD